jgi:hypothetical protein
MAPLVAGFCNKIGQRRQAALVKHETSRFPRKERPHMPGSATAPSQTGARNNAPAHVAFRQQNGVGTQKKADFAAQWLAYAIPCQRFADVLADYCARLGDSVACYTFTVMDFHHLLLAGLPAHSALGLETKTSQFAANAPPAIT